MISYNRRFLTMASNERGIRLVLLISPASAHAWLAYAHRVQKGVGHVMTVLYALLGSCTGHMCRKGLHGSVTVCVAVPELRLLNYYSVTVNNGAQRGCYDRLKRCYGWTYRSVLVRRAGGPPVFTLQNARWAPRHPRYDLSLYHACSRRTKQLQ
jgi:hypothetical protein